MEIIELVIGFIQKAKLLEAINLLESNIDQSQLLIIKDRSLSAFAEKLSLSIEEKYKEIKGNISKSITTEEVTTWTYDENYQVVYKTEIIKHGQEKIKAFYVELNDFSINPDLWFVDINACTEGPNDDPDWFFESIDDFTYPIDGLQDIQEIYKWYNINKTNFNSNQMDLCDYLVICRVMELFQFAADIGFQNNHSWCKIPCYVTVHDADFWYKVKRKK